MKVPVAMTNNTSKPCNQKNMCYTCFQTRPHWVQKFVIHINYQLKYEIHQDMRKRNMIIVTPFEHVSSLEYLESNRFVDIVVSVKKLLYDYAKIKGHRLIISDGTWQRHDHLHLKFELESNDIETLLQNIPQLNLH